MAEAILIAERATFADAKAEALSVRAKFGKSPTVRRHFDGWALYASSELAKLMGYRPHPTTAPLDTDAGTPPTAPSRLRPAPRPGATKLPVSGLPSVAPTPKREQRGKAKSASDVQREKDQATRAARDAASRAAWASTIKAARTQHQTSRGPTRSHVELDRARATRLGGELRIAFATLPASDLKLWLERTLKRLGFVFSRRVVGVADLAWEASGATGREVMSLIEATFEGRLGPHAASRLGAGKRKIVSTAQALRQRSQPLLNELIEDPRRVAPDLLVGALSFYLAGGGFDGDGGIPDADISLFGIEAHRSLFTHSIVAGTIVETSLLALVDFIGIAHDRLPKKHDPWWDTIYERLHAAARSAAGGASLGLAYHLGVDSTIQPGAYHDLPFELSMDGHRVILGANAAAEAIDVSRRRRPTRPETEPSTTVKQVLVGAGSIAALLLGLG